MASWRPRPGGVDSRSVATPIEQVSPVRCRAVAWISARLVAEDRRLDRASNRLGEVERRLGARVRNRDHEFVAAISSHELGWIWLETTEQVADLPQDLASGQVAVAVVDELEVVEIEKEQRQVVAALLRLCDRALQREVEVAIVVEAGEVVPFRVLVRQLAVEDVLDRDRDVVGEDLQEIAIGAAVLGRTLAIDELEDAADLDADPDRDRDQGLRLVLRLGVDARVEQIVLAARRR